MKILLTGANGFLGYYLSGQILESGDELIATGKGECRLPYLHHKLFHYQSMDFTDPFSVHDVFLKYRPDIVIHAGAMSNVDECETNQWQAYKTNVEGTVTMLLNAEEHKCFFIFISTDFVFDGEAGMYREDDPTGPVNFYGKTKKEAEEAVMEYEQDWCIVRTILVYGKPNTGKKNLLNIVKEKLESGEKYNVVSDQVRTPTYVEDLAAGIISVVQKKAKGIFHISGKDILTPYAMAGCVADHFGLDKSLIREVTVKNFSQPAKRPPKTGFIIDKAKMELGYDPISFDEGLKRTFS